MLVMQMATGGELNAHLKAAGLGVSKAEHCRYCVEASAGMKYLEKNGVLHRDVAARNCLLNGDGVLKLSDFGLSMHQSTFKETRMRAVPVKWLAPETIMEKVGYAPCTHVE